MKCIARWFANTTVLATASILVLHCPAAPATSSSRPLDDAARAEATFEEGGEISYLIEGNMYRRDAKAGKLAFVDHWYDPDFYEQNFVMSDGVVNQRDPNTGKLYPMRRHFVEDFENATRLTDLMNENRGWTNMALESPKTPGVPQSNALVKQILRGEATYIDNRVEPSGEIVHTGKSALKCYCVPKSPDMITTKASISSFFMHFRKGDDVWFRGWYYLAEGGRPFTVMDLESTWIKKHPGMRICMPESGFLQVELKWTGKPTHRQARGQELPFPVGRWVELRLHLRLTETQDGIIELWQDGLKIIDSKGQTLPLANTIYDSLEIGISANGFDQRPATLYVDDVAVSTDSFE